jgi:hypothetical protein
MVFDRGKIGLRVSLQVRSASRDCLARSLNKQTNCATLAWRFPTRHFCALDHTCIQLSHHRQTRQSWQDDKRLVEGTTSPGQPWCLLARFWIALILVIASAGHWAINFLTLQSAPCQLTAFVSSGVVSLVLLQWEKMLLVLCKMSYLMHRSFSLTFYFWVLDVYWLILHFLLDHQCTFCWGLSEVSFSSFVACVFGGLIHWSGVWTRGCFTQFFWTPCSSFLWLRGTQIGLGVIVAIRNVIGYGK